jgi:RNA polymerase sigma factor (sigma-70 family)
VAKSRGRKSAERVGFWCGNSGAVVGVWFFKLQPLWYIHSELVLRIPVAVFCWQPNNSASAHQTRRFLSHMPNASKSVVLNEPSDEQLLASIAQQSERALEVLYDRHAGVVYSLARKIVRSPRDAEEVLQDVFLRIWTRAEDYNALKGKALTWVLTITHHLAIDQYRRNQVRQTETLEENSHQGMLEPEAINGSLERMAAQNALQKLEPAERLVLEALYFEGLSQSQLASRSGIPLGTIKSKARLALQQLKKIFDE